MKVLFDTSAFVAFEDRSEARHESARAFWNGLSANDRCLTTSYVIDETITRLRYLRGLREAVGFAEAISRSLLISTIWVDKELVAAGLAVLKKHRDQRLSFTDCVTIAVAKAERVDAIFAFDDDFRKVGLRTLPDRP